MELFLFLNLLTKHIVFCDESGGRPCKFVVYGSTGKKEMDVMDLYIANILLNKDDLH
jgi:hypothetical protein